MAQIIAIPDLLNNRGHDYVWFNYTRAGVASVVNRAACYAQCMTFLPECDFTLRPSDDKSVLPFDIFKKYVELCQANGLINQNAVVSGGEGNNQLIVPKGHNRHKVYSTLCCYRWSENQPGVAYATVAALDKFPEIDFFQAFHYGCARRAYWLIHSFHYIMMAKSTYSSNLGDNGALYVPNSMALAHCFRNFKDEKGKTPVEKWVSTDYTSNSVNAAMISLKFPDCKDSAAKKYKVKDLDQILSPKLTKLYRQPVTQELVEKTIMEV